MASSEPICVDRSGIRLVGERRAAPGPTVVLLHAGVSDRRSWRQLVDELPEDLDVVSYDRRGFGETPPSHAAFSHVDDLIAVLDQCAGGPAWLVGSSMGGGVALDAALAAPERVAGLVLIAPAVGGSPVPDVDADTARLDRLIGEATEARNLDELNRLETWLWLDGPAQTEGRVAEPARRLFRTMNNIVLNNAVPEQAGDSGLDAWDRLGEVRCPATVACGTLDVPFLLDRSRLLAERLPHGNFRAMQGAAHLPQLECPAALAHLVVDALRRNSH